MFLKLNVMLFLYFRILLPHLFPYLISFIFGCGAIFIVYEKAYTKMAPQGATLRCDNAKHIPDNSVLAAPLKLSRMFNV